MSTRGFADAFGAGAFGDDSDAAIRIVRIELWRDPAGVALPPPFNAQANAPVNEQAHAGVQRGAQQTMFHSALWLDTSAWRCDPATTIQRTRSLIHAAHTLGLKEVHRGVRPVETLIAPAWTQGLLQVAALACQQEGEPCLLATLVAREMSADAWDIEGRVDALRIALMLCGGFGTPQAWVVQLLDTDDRTLLDTELLSLTTGSPLTAPSASTSSLLQSQQGSVDLLDVEERRTLDDADHARLATVASYDPAFWDRVLGNF